MKRTLIRIGIVIFIILSIATLLEFANSYHDDPIEDNTDYYDGFDKL
jgi:hypothetical protein|tara:strand:- start:425 stop:565 length:141 start_codon:yes stop_codon:yes gene_type:complete